jgi:uncharacterized protein YjlB
MTPETLLLGRNDWMPNNARLPVLIYRRVLPAGATEQKASGFETMFEENGWPPQWRDSVYLYHHYHSTAHEVLGFAAGSALLMLGGPRGAAVKVSAGDVVLLPTGTGHRRIKATPNFLVVGAYPKGQKFDICRAAPTPAMVRRMATLPFPKSDPLAGKHGPMVELWR